MIWNPDPVLISLGMINIHWYGALFAIGIIIGLQLMKWIFVREGESVELVDKLFTYAILGIIIGARLGHCLFYEPEYYLSNPIEILKIWQGGLASHGGGIGVIIALYLGLRKEKMKTLWLLDRLTIATAIFAVCVRVANFINAEIVGIPTQSSWGIVFERVDMLARHPAQLYEAAAYLLIFILLVMLYKFTRIKSYAGLMLGIFLCLTFIARFLIENVKVKQAAFAEELALSVGQLLSLPFIVMGVYLLMMGFNQYRKSG